MAGTGFAIMDRLRVCATQGKHPESTFIHVQPIRLHREFDMHRGILVTAALISAAVGFGAGVEQPKDTKQNPHAAQQDPKQPGKDAAKNDQKQPEPKPMPPAKPEDVQSIDAIVKAFYDSTAGPAGKARDWDRFRSLFIAEARMIPVRRAPHDTGNELLAMSVDGYIGVNKNYFEKGGFFEKEVARRTEQFDNIAQVWSTYESRRSKDDPEPYTRGVYSMQLAFNGERWFLINVMWNSEQQDVKLPEKYLKTPTE
jgi:hypothetical protein